MVFGCDFVIESKKTTGDHVVVLDKNRRIRLSNFCLKFLDLHLHFHVNVRQFAPKLIFTLKQLLVNIPLVKVLEKMYVCFKYIKDLVTKGHEPLHNIHLRVIGFHTLVQKKQDPYAFIIPFTVLTFNFSKALYVLS